MTEVLFRYKKRPPQDFIDLMVTKLNEYYGISNMQWSDDAVAFMVDHCAPRNGQWWENLMAMREGLHAGYALAAKDKNQPWSFQYEKLELRAEYKDKTEKEVYALLGLDYYEDDLPHGKVYKKTRTTVKAVSEYEINTLWCQLNNNRGQFPLKHTMTGDVMPEFKYNPLEDFSLEPIWG